MEPKKCCGNCGKCSGCAGSLELTGGEMSLLEQLAQIPFLPFARKADSETPVFLEGGDYTVPEYGLILLCLERKGLISMDSVPLKGCSYEGYEGYPIRGSIALTARGQGVLELLQTQGILD